MMSCAAFAEKLELAAYRAKAGLSIPTERVMYMAEAQAREVIGTYRFGWTPLAESTMDDRERKGYSRDDPLLRTGELAASIAHATARFGGGAQGLVYSDDKVALYQEMGTETIPARSFLYRSVIYVIPDMRKIFGDFAVAILTTGV